MSGRNYYDIILLLSISGGDPSLYHYYYHILYICVLRFHSSLADRPTPTRSRQKKKKNHFVYPSAVTRRRRSAGEDSPVTSGAFKPSSPWVAAEIETEYVGSI